jgi:hypothetical protein
VSLNESVLTRICDPRRQGLDGHGGFDDDASISGVHEQRLGQLGIVVDPNAEMSLFDDGLHAVHGG